MDLGSDCGPGVLVTTKGVAVCIAIRYTDVVLKLSFEEVEGPWGVLTEFARFLIRGRRTTNMRRGRGVGSG